MIVLEKHADFLRDFRGGTIHPSTLEPMGDLGLLGKFLELANRRLDEAKVRFAGTTLTLESDSFGASRRLCLDSR